MAKSGGDRVVDWFWRLCNVAFESGVVPKNWISATRVKERGQNAAIIEVLRLLSVVGKIYAGILVLVNKVIEGLIDDEQGVFRARRGRVDY